ncbi:hypothetical protein [Actinoplanes regularis]|uniref:hypothetical protein n=1 Tax=Actinoplanes regularis TaxID=52697 RepID=UPI000B782EEC|nr:hypothetical protein [Actinoplanes regularis]
MPRGVVVAVTAQALVLAYGGLVHMTQIAGEWPPYPWAPAWLAAYFTSLTVLDPLAAWLLLDQRRAGLHLAVWVDGCGRRPRMPRSTRLPGEVLSWP